MEQTRYIQVSWTLPLKTTDGSALLPSRIAGIRVRFWRMGELPHSTDVPPHMTSITINLALGEWYVTASAVLHDGTEGRASVPKAIRVGVVLPSQAPRAPTVSVRLLPSSS